ncbi:gliding motility-associated C-terminal domain-containing protein [Cytophagaceae bacterium DM2B3-1]|uniref:Gliding motility-associated C-terminal domain-containing protein n=1 Tax=Xanthocytophaga flava TaxID=3048013 RepID=A0ABT7CI55_9BACT|nr:gliding motility-associated C-terminal domain-containing protein [Xanthocytophaga flavus]MDJ1493421.1 gliding motility-associated C-terminal domain-containing protein [Xanthocytophaga flavus]
MKKYLLLTIVCFLVSVQFSKATHIVGGEFELTSTDSLRYIYKLALNLYFDDINGNPGAEDDQIYAVIFNKRTNQQVITIPLYKTGGAFIPYTNPNCSQSNLRTRLIRYEQNIFLSPDYYTEAAGYYVVWERCCRNQTIINIQSPGAAGNSFYLEFPPVHINKKTFINSSPIFTIPKGDYACVNKPFTFDFGATDADGDELRYSLVTPFSGHSTQQTPSPPSYPAPYDEVIWARSINLNNVIPGPKPLRVDPKTGVLSFTANRVGLYVFSVLCEEYRNNIKIGGVRRDFQLLVVDCPTTIPPVVQLKEKGKTSFYKEGEIMILKASQEDRCMDLLLSDANGGTNLKVKINPINFSQDMVSISPASGTIRNAQDTLRSKLCWSECATSDVTNPYEFDVIVEDDGCPRPEADTLRVKLIIEPLPNQKPTIETDLPGNTALIVEGNNLTFNVTGIDPDEDNISLEAVGRGFILSDLGMSFSNGTGKGSLKLPFAWNPICDKLQDDKVYIVDFIVTDKRCPNTDKKDTVSVRLQFQRQPNQKPEVTTTLPGNSISVTVGESIQFDILGTDPDNDPIVVKAIGRGFSLEEAGMQFRNGATGIGTLREPFLWVPDCHALQLLPDGKFIVDFLLQDNSCSPNNADTVSVEMNVKDIEFTFSRDSVPNVFTPNGDRFNETFQLYEYLPPDNCKDQFVKIEVYNRWGKLAFESTSREFSWTGFGFPTGVYYYMVKYRNSHYKGTVSLLR